MPIIASASVAIDAREGRILILKEIEKCGCLKASTIAKRTGKSLPEVKKELSALVSNDKIHCDKEAEICCADKEKLESFTRKIKKVQNRKPER